MGTGGTAPGDDTGRHGGTGTGSPHALIGGRYELHRQLGRGGMGVVWEAVDTRLNRQVAIKELLFRGAVDPDTQAQWVERARREAQAIARIGHEHVVAIHDIIEAEGQVWIVMEQVNPRSLADLVHDHGRLPVGTAARIGLEVLRGLRAVHAAGVLHRDVKPHNVLFRKDGRAVLMDFGIATFEGAAQVTRRHETVGTPQYLAPELAVPWSQRSQQAQRPAAPAADLWSLGVTLYEMVEGRAPFRGPTPFEVLEAVREAETPPMEHAGPLRPLIEGLLAKDPEKRTAAPRAEELLQHVAQETPVTSRFFDPAPDPSPTPRPVPRRTPRPPGRARRLRRAAAAGAVAVALLAGAGWVAVDVLGEDNPPPLDQSATYQRARKLGFLTIGVKADQPGLSEVVNEKRETYRGFDIDVAKAIGRHLGFDADHVRFQTVNTASREYFLRKGTVDLIVASYSITPDRKMEVDFAGPYYLAGQDFLIRKDRGIDGAEDLAGKLVCTVGQSTPAAQLPRYHPAVKVTLRTQYSKCVQALLSGTVDAVSTDDVILAGYRQQHADELELLGDPFTTEAYGVGLAKDDPALKRAVCDALAKEMASGGWDRAYRKRLKPLDPKQLSDPRPPQLAECGEGDQPG